MAKISADLLNTKSIFKNPGNVIFKIPSYQRRFVWNAENVKDMFDDFAEDSNNYDFSSISELDGYLLGSIVLIDLDTNSEYEVVDGQQRLTTLTLIYKSIANRYKKLTNDSDYAASFVYAQDFYYSNSKEKTLRINQDHQLSYYKTYKKIIDDEPISPDKINDSIDKNMYEVWDEINNHINTMSLSELNRFDEYLQDNVMLIKTVCLSKNKALQLFEVLNNRGQSLEQIDLIKNMFLQQVQDDDSDDFDIYWKNFSENMYIKKSNKGKLNDYSDDFLKYFVMANYGKNIKKTRLATFFREQIKHDVIGKNNIIKLIEKLSSYSNIFKNMIENPNSNEFSTSPLMYSLTHMKIKQFHQLLMMFYFTDVANDDELQLVREKVLSACVRMELINIYSDSSPNEIEKVMPRLVSKFNEKFAKTNSLSDAANSMIDTMYEYNMNKYNKIKAVLPSLRLKQDVAITLLKIIEILINKNNGIMAKPANNRGISLEHILPQNKPKDTSNLELNPEDNYDEIINYVGNLTLLRKNDNSSLKDKTFDLKKEEYGKTDLFITKSIVGKFVSIPKGGTNASYTQKITNSYERSYYQKNVWNKDCIMQRGQELANLIADFSVGKF